MSKRTLLVNLDLNKNELQNAVIQPLATAPANPKFGQIYTNSTDKVIYQFDGERWKPVGVVYNQEGTTGAVIVGLDSTGTVTTKNVVELTLTGYTPVDGGYVAKDMTIQQAMAALDTAVKNAVAGGGEVNQNAWSNINVPKQSENDTTEVASQAAAATISASSKTDTFTLASGDKWTHVAADPTAKTITVGHAFSGATAGTYGDATHTVGVTVDAAGHVTAIEAKEIVGAQYITGLTSDAQEQLNSKIPASEKGAANGVATLGADGLVPAAQLPSYVDDVVEAYIVGETPLAADWLSLTAGGEALTPETGKIYVVMTEGAYQNKQYRWGGTTYVLCNPSDVNSVNGKTGVVVLTQDDIGAGTTYTQFSKEDKTKLDAVAEGATNNTITLNGTATKDPAFFAPTGAGEAGQILVSGGADTAPTWQAMPVHLKKYSTNNPVLTAAGGAYTWTIAAQDNGPTFPMLVQVYEVATNNMVIADVSLNEDNSITVVINQTDSTTTTLAADTYKVVAIG